MNGSYENIQIFTVSPDIGVKGRITRDQKIVS